MKLSNLIADDKDLNRMSNSKVVGLMAAITLCVVFVGLSFINKKSDDTLAWAITSLAGVTTVSRMYKAIKGGSDAGQDSSSPIQ